jgi:acyl carrier protein
MSETTAPLSKEQIETDLCTILTDMTADWDLPSDAPITGETRLMADLAFESIDVVQLVVAIEAHFKKRQMHFEHLLMVDGRYVQELQVKQISEFLEKALAA